jgi:16S rRNA processing protein RimM
LKSSSKSQLSVGFVLRAHGIRGALRIRAASDLSQIKTIEIDGQVRAVVRAERDKDDWLVTVQGIADRNASEALRGKPVRVDRDAVAVADDEVLVAELIGCRVVDLAGQLLGEVTGSFDSGAHEVLEVRAPSGQEFMVPFVDAIVTHVDVAARSIVCDPPPGLIDLDEADEAGKDDQDDS